MQFRLPPGLLEATRLTRAGRLVEATALLQRSLRQQPGPEVAANDPAPGRVIDAEFSRAGNFISGSYGNHAGTRPYKLYIPDAPAGKALPLIVMLHGCTQTPDDFAAGTRMNELAEAQACFVLYPAQTQAGNPSRCWNWFKRGDQRRDQGEPAIIAGMTRDVQKRYGIDARRIYVAGLSAGGAMAAVVGEAYPDLYAAIGVHSGLAVGSAHDVPSAFAAMRGMQSSSPGGSARAVPIIVFHGDQDTTVHPSNGEQVISGAGDVAVDRGRVPGGHGYTRTVHSDPAGRVMVEHWLVHGAGHAWSGGSARGSYTDPKGPDATREMRRFFDQVSAGGSS